MTKPPNYIIRAAIPHTREREGKNLQEKRQKTIYINP
jgi:hypothetical protein